MAEFAPAFENTMRNEGGYANHPDDPGGETYRGISRRWHPDWPGWIIIDRVKDYPSFPAGLESDNALNESVRYFYRVEYWDKISGDIIPSQALANEIFDTSVIMESYWAISFLQQALNALNRDGKDYDDVYTDGKLGPVTLGVLAEYLDQDDESLLLKIMDGLLLTRFIKLMREDPKKEIFARGWIRDRIQIWKN